MFSEFNTFLKASKTTRWIFFCIALLVLILGAIFHQVGFFLTGLILTVIAAVIIAVSMWKDYFKKKKSIENSRNMHEDMKRRRENAFFNSVHEKGLLQTKKDFDIK